MSWTVLLAAGALIAHFSALPAAADRADTLSRAADSLTAAPPRVAPAHPPIANQKPFLERHPVLGPTLLLTSVEGMVALWSSAAYAGDRGRTLAGVTALCSLGALNSEEGNAEVGLFAMLGLAGLEFALGAGGASENALFWTSFAGIHGVVLASTAFRPRR